MRKAIHSRAFTLIELLVVVAIVALLIALILPALSKAKLVTKRTTCLANLKGIGVAINMYMTQNNDITPELNWLFLPGHMFGGAGKGQYNYEGTYVLGAPLVWSTWVEQLIADGCAPIKVMPGGVAPTSYIGQYGLCGRGIFLCPGWDGTNDNVGVVVHPTDKGDNSLSGPSGAEPNGMGNRGYGLSFYASSRLGHSGGSNTGRAWPVGKEGADDPENVFSAQGGMRQFATGEGQRRNIMKGSYLIPGHIVAYDGWVVRNTVSPWAPSGPAYGLYKRHFGAPNYLFGDGSAAWNGEYHLLKPRPNYTVQAVLKNATVWRHNNSTGGLTDPVQY